jgi:hypothetical protein
MARQRRWKFPHSFGRAQWPWIGGMGFALTGSGALEFAGIAGLSSRCLDGHPESGSQPGDRDIQPRCSRIRCFLFSLFKYRVALHEFGSPSRASRDGVQDCLCLFDCKCSAGWTKIGQTPRAWLSRLSGAGFVALQLASLDRMCALGLSEFWFSQVESDVFGSTPRAPQIGLQHRVGVHLCS